MERRFISLKKGKQDTTTRKERKLLPIEEYMETSIQKEIDVLGREKRLLMIQTFKED